MYIFNNLKDFSKMSKIFYGFGVLSWLMVMVGCNPVDPSDVLVREVAKILGSDVTTNDRFGYSAVTDGNIAIIGAPRLTGTDSSDVGIGSAYIYTRSGNSWSEQAKLTASDGADNDWFGRSVAVVGNIAFVGAPNDKDTIDYRGQNEGAIYIFTRNGTNWTEQQKLRPNDPNVRSFGLTMALDGDTIVIGTYVKLYVFTLNGTNLVEQATIPAPSTGNFNGLSMSLGGDTLIIGGSVGDVNAYIFTRSGTNWTQQAELRASDEHVRYSRQYGSDASGFGFSVALEGDIAIVGARLAYSPDRRLTGGAYIFTRSGTNWTEQTKLTPIDGVQGGFFGSSVAIDGDMIVVGADGEDHKAYNAGAAHIFTRNGNTWSEQSTITASDADPLNAFGSKVAIRGDMIFVSASGDNTGVPRSGSAYIYQVQR